jgi:hypothetical protein
MEVWGIYIECVDYEVSTHGNVRNKHTHKILPTVLSKMGYKYVELIKDNSPVHRSVHRMVALAWVKGFKCGLVADHIDRNRLNNHYTNLRWVTQQRNCYNKTLQKRNKSGMNGVTRSGNSWVAKWYKNNKPRTASYNIMLYGDDLAKALAIKRRNKEVAKILEKL